MTRLRLSRCQWSSVQPNEMDWPHQGTCRLPQLLYLKMLRWTLSWMQPHPSSLLDGAAREGTSLSQSPARSTNNLVVAHPAFGIAAAIIVASSACCGRSRTNRAATPSASKGFQMLPGTRSSVETNVLAASSLGIAASRVASSHGSTFIRARGGQHAEPHPVGFLADWRKQKLIVLGSGA